MTTRTKGIPTTRTQAGIATANTELVALEKQWKAVCDQLTVLAGIKDSLRTAILSKLGVVFGEDGSVTWTSPETGGELTRIFAERLKVDDVALRSTIGASILPNVTKSVFDTEKLGEALKTGLLTLPLSGLTVVPEFRLQHKGGVTHKIKVEITP
jgi:hypothetical protein